MKVDRTEPGLGFIREESTFHPLILPMLKVAEQVLCSEGDISHGESVGRKVVDYNFGLLSPLRTLRGAPILAKNR